MILQKTVKAKLFSLTRIKEAEISSEYWNFQRALKGEDVPLYSATKQQAQRKKRSWRGDGEHPLILRRDCFKVKELGKKITKWWAKIPVFGGSIYCPIQLLFWLWILGNATSQLPWSMRTAKCRTPISMGQKLEESAGIMHGCESV